MKFNMQRVNHSLILFLFVLSFNHVFAAINPVSVVYRFDFRDLDAIHRANGMYPWETEDTRQDNDLTHHFEGESLEDHTSSFVSTTSSLASSVEFAASLARPNSEEPFDHDFIGYIYFIRPDLNFYDVDQSLAHARDALPTMSPDRDRFTRLINDYGGLHEWVAHDGFSQDRIMSVVEITGALLNQYGVASNSPLLRPSFWSARIINNPTYNQNYNSATSSSLPYDNAAAPRGIIYEANVGNQPQVPLRFTCWGENQNSTYSQTKESVALKQFVCPTKYSLNIWDKKLFIAILNATNTL